MKHFWSRSRDKHGDLQPVLQAVRDKFVHFHTLLDKNQHVLEIISDMEEKSQGDFLFDLNYIKSCLKELRSGVREIIEQMIALGGEQYQPLQKRFSIINAEVDLVLPGNRPVREDNYTRRLKKLDRMYSYSVGSKNAQMGEMKSKLGLPVPLGFAITAWAYKRFIDANDLQSRISKRIDSLDIRSYEDLERVSQEIRAMVITSPVPDDLTLAIQKSTAELAEEAAVDRFSLRSSAIGEDTLLSFAGQYASYLNVCANEVVDCYREVLAGKFTPKAIYYFLSHSLSEAQLTMSVGCVAMVDAAAAGVAYTRSPVNPADDAIVVNSIFGLGKYLVDGTLTPDTFKVSRNDLQITESQIAYKPVRLVMAPDGGTVEEPISEAQRREPSITEQQLKQLAQYAITLEDHYDRPQDIEWIVDQEGHLLLLQTRPLQVMATHSDTPLPDLSKLDVIMSGGTTVCPGAGSGRIHHVTSAEDLPGVSTGAVLVAPNPFPGLITVMAKINALITCMGGIASHMATIAREYRIPTLTGITEALELPTGTLVTVDATGGIICSGAQQELVAIRQTEYDLPEEESILDILGRVLDLISPLRLIHPDDDDFIAENCVTFHDITRFAHQKAMEEMFFRATGVTDKEGVGLPLKTDIPLNVMVIHLDKEHVSTGSKQWITEKEIASAPMKSFWMGIKKERWPRITSSVQQKGPRVSLDSSGSQHARGEYSENSFAILSDEYMVLCLRMGYHFSTLEAMCSNNVNKNYIRFQFNYGGAPLERRKRRIRLITQILKRMNFECHHKGDFVDARVSYKDTKAVLERLYRLGRLTIMTKQLDMALSNDAIARWYTQDFMKKLGLEPDDKHVQ